MTKEEDGVESKPGRDGATFWYLHGVIHRDDGPAIEFSTGEKWWFQFGKEHREDGPAIERPDGSKQWFRDGKHHREDGPAVEFADGRKKQILPSWGGMGGRIFDPRAAESRERPPQEKTALSTAFQIALEL